MDKHLTTIDIEHYVEKLVDEPTRALIDQHLDACTDCRARITQSQKFETSLRTITRETPPPGLADLIIAAVEWRVGQEEQRRTRMPLIAIATAFSLLLAFWFGLETMIAFQENGVLDFWALFTSHTEISYSRDALLALIEAFPVTETILMLFALFTAAVLGQSLVDSFRPRVVELK